MATSNLSHPNSSALHTASRAKIPDDHVLDRGLGRLRPRARLLRTIGSELISSEIVAVLELVRNSYDADASFIRVVFENVSDPEGATLELLDDGHGMTRKVLLGPWMEPATNHKSSSNGDGFAGQFSPKGRRRLGSKGVGRFAAQRLGRNLVVRTFARREEGGIQAEFDWDLLQEGEQYLDQLEIPWKQFHKPKLELQGTSLFISELQDEWDFDRFQKLRIALARLLGPEDRDDPFRIQLVIDGNEEDINPAIEQLPPMYTIEGEVEEGGYCSITYSDHTGVQEDWVRHLFWLSDEAQVCGPFRFQMKAWDLDKEAVQLFLEGLNITMGLRDFRRLIRDHSGINLYRDHFRILPYGEPDNDWLRLDHRRVNNPTMRLSNNQLLGQIFLSAENNPLLQDQTNREGLVVNKSYEHLQAVVLELIGYLENRRFVSRRNLNVGPRLVSSRLPGIKEGVGENVEKMLEGLQKNKPSAKIVKNLRTAIDDWHQDTIDNLRQYAGLAATGQVAGLLFSQLSLPLHQSVRDLDYVREEISDEELEESFQEEVITVLDKVTERLEQLLVRLEKLDPLAINGRARQLEEISLVDCVRDVLDIFSERLIQKGIEFDLGFEEACEVQTDPSVIQQVVSLILDNTVYWLGKNSQERQLWIEVTPDGLSLTNNGPLISESVQMNIFDPHFTTREDAAGMGLTLAQDLLRSIGATIKCTSEQEEGVRFQICLDRYK